MSYIFRTFDLGQKEYLPCLSLQEECTGLCKYLVISNVPGANIILRTFIAAYAGKIKSVDSYCQCQQIYCQYTPLRQCPSLCSVYKVSISVKADFVKSLKLRQV